MPHGGSGTEQLRTVPPDSGHGVYSFDDGCAAQGSLTLRQGLGTFGQVLVVSLGFSGVYSRQSRLTLGPQSGVKVCLWSLGSGA